MCEVIGGHHDAISSQKDMDSAMIEQFIADRLEMAEGERVESTDLYAAFCDWCTLKGIKPRTHAWFGRRVHRVLERERGKTVRYVGARLLN